MRAECLAAAPWTILWTVTFGKDQQPIQGASAIPSERSIVDSITRRLNRDPCIWHFKTHGSAFSKVGVPDIVGVMNGRFFALEVKRPRLGRVSPIQRYVMEKIATAGGLVAVVECVEDACSVLRIQK